MIGSKTLFQVCAFFSLCLLGACVSLGPSFEEQTDAMGRAQFSASSRFAVAVRDTNGHAPISPISVEMADLAASEVATILAETLGVQAESLSAAPESGWSNALQQAKDGTGWVKAGTTADYFRELGYDGYVLLTLYEKWNFTRKVGGGPRDDFFNYTPVFHLIRFDEGNERTTLMQAGLGQVTGFRCDLFDIEDTEHKISWHLEPEECAKRISLRFAAELKKRRG